MKTLFVSAAREELKQRVISLNESSTPVWGKMNVFQMAKHCTIWNDWVLGNEEFIYKQDFLGKLFGKMALKSNTKDDKPISRNMPAGRSFTVKEKEGDLNAAIAAWIEQINSFEKFSNSNFIHDFFGNMTDEQLGIFAYKHNDHHLRQFNV
ncbi:MAG: DUF1569 domain-containing protein [Ignavibacteria bacterium]|nr:DUF1569 domain-containing protein [Ignavibacteria bacterium]